MKELLVFAYVTLGILFFRRKTGKFHLKRIFVGGAEFFFYCEVNYGVKRTIIHP